MVYSILHNYTVVIRQIGRSRKPKIYNKFGHFALLVQIFSQLEMPLTSTYPCEICQGWRHLQSHFTAIYQRCRPCGAGTSRAYRRRPHDLRKFTFWNLSFCHTADRGSSKFVHWCTTATRDTLKGLLKLFRVCVSTKWPLSCGFWITRTYLTTYGC